MRRGIRAPAEVVFDHGSWVLDIGLIQVKEERWAGTGNTNTSLVGILINNVFPLNLRDTHN